MKVLPDLQIVLVEPEQPRNVGAVVRVAANFGLKDVAIVRAENFDPEEQRQIKIASSGAADIVTVTIYKAIGEALNYAELVVGSSGRQRDDQIPLLSNLASLPPGRRISILFGRESNGLKSSELNMCHYLLRLPTSEQFPSMNLSHAVAVAAYQVLTAEGQGGSVQPGKAADRQMQESLIRKATGDEHGNEAAQLRRFLLKASPTDEELSLLFNLLKKNK